MSEPIKMRTRLLSKMNNAEVEKYLDRNSIIFVPVGTVELSGQMPMDNEYISPAGLALACAEKVDGLVLDGLKYFYTHGGTEVGRGSVQVSVRAGYDYLKEILISLWCQGFKEIITVSGHGPAEKTVCSCIWDLFDETKQHFYWMDVGKSQHYAERLLKPEVHGIKNFGKVHLGCYEIMGCRHELVVNPDNAKMPDHWDPDATPMQMAPESFGDRKDLPEGIRNMLHAMNFSGFSDVAGFFFGSIEDHGGDNGAFPSEEVRDAYCIEGLKQLHVMVDLMDMPKYITDIRKQQEYTSTVIKNKFHHLPKNRYTDWK
jgi:creatinine amidohydrolase